MASNRVSYLLTPENLLDRMDLGHPYTMYQLAAKFKVATAEIIPVVLQLVADGAIMKQHSPKNCSYTRPAAGESAPPSKPAGPQVFLSVAAPPRAPDMKHTLVGYEAEIARHAQLCMLARGAR